MLVQVIALTLSVALLLCSLLWYQLSLPYPERLPANPIVAVLAAAAWCLFGLAHATGRWSTDTWELTGSAAFCVVVVALVLEAWRSVGTEPSPPIGVRLCLFGAPVIVLALVAADVLDPVVLARTGVLICLSGGALVATRLMDHSWLVRMKALVYPLLGLASALAVLMGAWWAPLPLSFGIFAELVLSVKRPIWMGSSSRYRAVVNRAGAGVLVFDKRQRLVGWNGEAEVMALELFGKLRVGMALDQVIHRPVENLRGRAALLTPAMLAIVYPLLSPSGVERGWELRLTEPRNSLAAAPSEPRMLRMHLRDSATGALSPSAVTARLRLLSTTRQNVGVLRVDVLDPASHDTDVLFRELTLQLGEIRRGLDIGRLGPTTVVVIAPDACELSDLNIRMRRLIDRFEGSTGAELCLSSRMVDNADSVDQFLEKVLEREHSALRKVPRWL